MRSPLVPVLVPVLAAAPVLGALAPLASAELHVVSISGGGDFVQIQAAVDAAADGDVVLVEPPGFYQPFVVDGKSLTIRGNGAAPVLGPVVVRNVPSSGTVVLAGLSVTSFGFLAREAVSVESSAGLVLLQDLVLQGGQSFGSFAAGGDGAVVASSAQVVLARVTATGGSGDGELSCSGASGGSAGGNGLGIHSSIVAVYESELAGGAGGQDAEHGGDGGHGVLVDGGSSIFAVRSELQGGLGGGATDDVFCGHDAGNGGTGLRLEDGIANVLEVASVGGAGGFPGKSGIPGSDYVVGDDAALHFVPGAARSFAATGLLQGGGTLALELEGEPGELAFLLVSPAIVYQGVSPSTGILFPLGAAPAPFGALPPSGQLSFGVPLPPLPPGLEHVVLHGQAGFVDPVSGSARLSNPSTLVRL